MTKQSAEELVEKALLKLVEDGAGGIVKFHKTEHNGVYDTDGIDFFVYLSSGICVPLQVKRKESEVKYHRRKYPHVKAVVVVRPKSKLPLVQKRILRVVQDLVSFLKTQP